MVEFPVNPNAVRPVQEFQVPHQMGRRLTSPGFRKISALKRTTEVIDFRDRRRRVCVATLKSPGRTEYEAITLERGLTQDGAFEDWANKTWRLGAFLGSEVALA